MSEEWTKDWQRGEPEATEEVVQWMSSRPRAVKDIMIRFPPACLVRSKPGCDLMTPEPGATGFVNGYREKGDGTIMLLVVQGPKGRVLAECDPDWLEVVGYRSGQTPDFVRGVIGEGGRA